MFSEFTNCMHAFVEQIAKAVGEHPRLVSHHLDACMLDIGMGFRCLCDKKSVLWVPQKTR